MRPENVAFSLLGDAGRMGNALFQVAVTVSKALDQGGRAIFPSEWEYREDFQEELTPYADFLPRHIIQAEFRNVYREPRFEYNSIPELHGCDLLGYFQSEKYFKKYADIIEKIFRKTTLNFLFGDNSDQLWGFVHVRRGDYVQLQNYHPVQPVSYYENGIEILRRNGVEVFFLISDDMEWTRSNLGKIPGTRILPTGGTRHDYQLMLSCSGSVMSNSSFSWWGSYLKHQRGPVIYPLNWFGSSYGDKSIKDLIPEGWTGI